MMPEATFEDIAVEEGPVDVATWFPEWYIPTDRSAEFERTLAEQTQLFDINVKALGADTRFTLAALQGLSQPLTLLRRVLGLKKCKAVGTRLAWELGRKSYDKLVIFAIHKGTAETLRLKLARFGALTIYDKSPLDRRARTLKRFQTKPRRRVLICNVKSMLNLADLSVASNVVFIEPEWDPMLNAQAVFRVHNRRQTRPVYVRFFGLKGTSDELVSAAMRRRTCAIVRDFRD